MRWIVNYFRQVFCKHEWYTEEKEVIISNPFLGSKSNNRRVYMRCTKCGYHKKHWKY